jgi:hypothetical protein
MTIDVDVLLGDLDDHVKIEMSANPEIVEKGDDLDLASLPITARKWHKLDEAVAVVADLKGSTNLGVGKHAASTAAIYEAATGGATRILDAFSADFIAIQGDGVFGLFWGESRFQRAICAGITVKTFSERQLVPQLQTRWNELPPTGFKVGMAASKLLVKRVGIARTESQEPVWAGKAVNYAAKCAQQADAHEMLVTGSIWDFVQGNDYLAVSCPCGSGPSDGIWHNATIEKIHQGDGESLGRVLTSCWCPAHGAEYCAAVLAGQGTRQDVQEIMAAVRKAQTEDEDRRTAAALRKERRARQRAIRARGGSDR